MARMLKKLQQKVVPMEKKKASPPPGKDYLLLILMAFSVMVIVAAWETLDSLTLAMYILLTLSLGLTYARRHAAHRLSEAQMMLVTRAGFVTIGMAGALFLIDIYRRFIA